jgi:hypothetical protein
VNEFLLGTYYVFCSIQNSVGQDVLEMTFKGAYTGVEKVEDSEAMILAQ